MADVFEQFGQIARIEFVKNETNGQVHGNIYYSNKENAIKAMAEVKELKNEDDTILKVELIEKEVQSGNPKTFFGF